MSSSLGEKLRQAREERGISISEVAEQTRISPQYLEAIDADNYKTLPGGIFNKGFLRSYAKYVGVDEQEALQEYSRLVAANEEKEEDKYRPYRPEVLTDERASASNVPTVIFAVVILGLMTAGILFLVNYIQNQQSDTTRVTNTANVNSAESVRVATNSNTAGTVPGAPTMEGLKVEFRSIGEGISLRSVNDGVSSGVLVTSGRPAVFEPRQQLRLSYSRSLARSAQLSINGKSITLPSAPANPRRNVIEIDFNKDNVASFWESGTVSFGPEIGGPSANSANVTPSPEPARTIQRPRPVANTTVSVANSRPSAVRPSPTPIIVGRPDANNRRRPNLE